MLTNDQLMIFKHRYTDTPIHRYTKGVVLCCDAAKINIAFGFASCHLTPDTFGDR